MVRSDVFELQLDVNHYGSFDAKEITVRLVDDVVLIEGKQEWRSHPGGRVWKAFAHEHTLPKDVDAEKLTAFMTANGILMIKAPRLGYHRQEARHEERRGNVHSISMRSLGLTDVGTDMADSTGSPIEMEAMIPRPLVSRRPRHPFSSANNSSYGHHKNVTLGGVTEFKYRV